LLLSAPDDSSILAGTSTCAARSAAGRSFTGKALPLSSANAPSFTIPFEEVALITEGAVIGDIFTSFMGYYLCVNNGAIYQLNAPLLIKCT
jgi:hypothetical protein